MVSQTRRQTLSRIGVPLLTVANKAGAKKQKGLVPLNVLALSQENQDYYHEQKNNYQTIAITYIAWYTCQQEVSQNSNGTYFFCDPWEVDFEHPSGAPETWLDGFFNET